MGFNKPTSFFTCDPFQNWWKLWCIIATSGSAIMNWTNSWKVRIGWMRDGHEGGLAAKGCYLNKAWFKSHIYRLELILFSYCLHLAHAGSMKNKIVYPHDLYQFFVLFNSGVELGHLNLIRDHTEVGRNLLQVNISKPITCSKLRDKLECYIFEKDQTGTTE